MALTAAVYCLRILRTASSALYRGNILDDHIAWTTGIDYHVSKI